MATHIAGTNHALLLFPPPADISQRASRDEGRALNEERGNVFRGLFYAVIFNLFLLLTGAVGWVLWRIVR